MTPTNWVMQVARLAAKVYGKEQFDAGLIEEPALAFTVMADGELGQRTDPRRYHLPRFRGSRVG